jgi:hypothetical protein
MRRMIAGMIVCSHAGFRGAGGKNDDSIRGINVVKLAFPRARLRARARLSLIVPTRKPDEPNLEGSVTAGL